MYGFARFVGDIGCTGDIDGIDGLGDAAGRGERLRLLDAVEADLAGRTTPAPLRRVVALQAGRAVRLLEEGLPLVTSLTGFAARRALRRIGPVLARWGREAVRFPFPGEVTS